MNTGISWAAGGLIIANLGPTGSESGLGLSRICQWPGVRVGSGSESDPPSRPRARAAALRCMLTALAAQAGDFLSYPSRSATPSTRSRREAAGLYVLARLQAQAPFRNLKYGQAGTAPQA